MPCGGGKEWSDQDLIRNQNLDTHIYTYTRTHTHTRARSAKVHSVEMAKNSRTGTGSVSTLGGGYKINEKKGCFHGRTEPNRAVGSGCIVTGRMTTVLNFDNCSTRGEMSIQCFGCCFGPPFTIS